MAYTLSARSNSRLIGVHPDLARIVRCAIRITEVDFTVLEGVRDIGRQKEMVASGASTTMNLRHLRAENGYGHAVDLAPIVNGSVSWDWPLYHKIAKAMKQAAKELRIAIGADGRGHFRDTFLAVGLADIFGVGGDGRRPAPCLSIERGRPEWVVAPKLTDLMAAISIAYNRNNRRTTRSRSMDTRDWYAVAVPVDLARP